MDILSDVIKLFFGSKTDKDRKQIEPYVNKIKEIYPSIQQLSNDDLRARSAALMKQIADFIAADEAHIVEQKAKLEMAETTLSEKEKISKDIDTTTKRIDEKIEQKLDEILPEAFAIMKDTARRFAENETVEVTATDFDRNLQGLSGRYFKARPGAYVEWRGRSDYASRLDTCSRASLLFTTGTPLQLSVRLNDAHVQTRFVPPSDRLQLAVVEGRLGRVRWTVGRTDTAATFYGLCLDDVRGIALDNLSLRGSRGLSIRTIPEATLRAFGEVRPYDLIILQYGLNVATDYGRDYSRYIEGMDTVIRRLKSAFPTASLLLIGVGDRDFRDEEGRVRTMPGIKHLVAWQQQLAADNDIAFWNLFEGMGGESSMARLEEAEPPMANHDYAHINFRGGKYLASLLYEALMHGKEQSDKLRYERE